MNYIEKAKTLKGLNLKTFGNNYLEIIEFFKSLKELHTNIDYLNEEEGNHIFIISNGNKTRFLEIHITYDPEYTVDYKISIETKSINNHDYANMTSIINWRYYSNLDLFIRLPVRDNVNKITFDLEDHSVPEIVATTYISF